MYEVSKYFDKCLILLTVYCGFILFIIFIATYRVNLCIVSISCILLRNLDISYILIYVCM